MPQLNAKNTYDLNQIVRKKDGVELILVYYGRGRDKLFNDLNSKYSNIILPHFLMLSLVFPMVVWATLSIIR